MANKVEEIMPALQALGFNDRFLLTYPATSEDILSACHNIAEFVDNVRNNALIALSPATVQQLRINLEVPDKIARKNLIPTAKNLLTALEKRPPTESVSLAHFAMTSSRSELLEDLLVDAFNFGFRHTQSNSICRLLLGVKGVGKGFFLRAFTILASILFPQCLCIFVRWENLLPQLPAHCRSPAFIIWALARARGMDIPFHRNIGEVIARIEKKGYRVIFVCDDLHSVFKLPHPEGARIMADFSAIGEGPLALAAASGSSAYLQSLCFGKLEAPFPKLPSYDGICNLNPTRYQVRSLQPLGPDETALVWENIKAIEMEKRNSEADQTAKCRQEQENTAPQRVTDDANLDGEDEKQEEEADDVYLMDAKEVYITTGGRMRFLFNPAEFRNFFYAQLPKIQEWINDTFCKQLWQHLYNAAKTEHNAGKKKSEQEAPPLSSLYSVSVSTNTLQELGWYQPQKLLELADAGAVRLAETDDVVQRVSFAHPMHAAVCRDYLLSATLNPEDSIRSQFPYGKLLRLL